MRHRSSLIGISFACFLFNHASAAMAGRTAAKSGTAPHGAAPAGMARPPAELRARAAARQAYGQLPLSFEANAGQTAPEVKFLSRGPAHTLFFTPTDMVLVAGSEPSPARRHARPTPSTPEHGATPPLTMRMTLVGANPHARVEGVEPLPGTVNYFIGNDRSRWRTNVATYAKLRYTDVYPGVDLVYYGNQRQLEYDFVLAPGADPSAIQLAFDGADSVEVTAEGDLRLKTVTGEVRLRKPTVYQVADGVTHPVSGGYSLVASPGRKPSTSVVRFRLATHDRTKPLVIDPILFYSTYLGGSDEDLGNAVAVDPTGAAYIAGSTKSPTFPGTNPPAGVIPPTLTTGTGSDVFVAKLDSMGTLVYATYLGGGKDDKAYAIAVDASGYAYLTGETNSSDFPFTSGAFDTICGGDADCNGGQGVAFVARLGPTGHTLPYSSFLGGIGRAVGFGIATDGTGNAYVTGSTFSPAADHQNDPKDEFPVTAGAFSTLDPHLDSFMTKLNTNDLNAVVPCTIKGKLYNDCGDLLYSTYLNAIDQDDEGFAIAVDATGDVYVAGWTGANAFPTKNAFQAVRAGQRDLFLIRVTPDDANANVTCTFGAYTYNDCADLRYSTYFGSPAQDSMGDQARDVRIAIDPSGFVYVAGNTSSSAVPGKGGGVAPLLGPGGQWDIYVAKFDTSQSGDDSLVYSVRLGGSDLDFLGGIAVGNRGDVYVSGTTYSTDFPGAAGGPAPKQGSGAATSGDVFVAAVDPSGSSIDYATYLGGTGADSAHAIALDGSCNALVAGSTSSTDFPLANPLAQDPQAGLDVAAGGDAFLAKLTPHFAYRAYISNLGAGSLSVVDTQSQSVVGSPISLGAATVRPLGVAVDPDGSRVYVTHWADDSVSVVSTATNTVIATTSLAQTGGSPFGVAAHPRNNPFPAGRAYVANNLIAPGKTTATVSVVNPDGTLLDLDPFTDGVQGIELSGVSELFGVAVNPSGLELYTTYQAPNGGGVAVAPIPTGTALYPNSWPAYTIKVGDHPTGIAVINPGVFGASLHGGFSYNGSFAYVANRDSGTVSMLDLRNGSGINIFNTKVNFATPTTDIELKLPSDKPNQFKNRRPFGIAVHPNLRTVYVTDETFDNVFVLEFASPPPANQPAQPSYPTVTRVENYVASGPQGVAVTPDGSLVYVANANDNSISVIRTVDNQRIVFSGPNANANGDIALAPGDLPVAFGQFLGSPLIDRDGDRIWDLVDGHIDANGSFVDEAETPSTQFTNKHLCGSVSGEVVDANGLSVKIGSPGGLVIATGLSGGPAEVKLCNFTTKFFPNNVVEPLACGSLTARVLSGPMEVLLTGGGVLTVESGATFKVAESDGGGFLVEAFDRSVALAPGQSATLTQGGDIVVPDTIPPTTGAAPSPAAPNGANGWYLTDATVTLTATDNAGGSGVKQIEYSTSGAQAGSAVVAGASATLTLSAEGTTTLTYFAVDNAGNQEAPKTLTVKIDKTPPRVSCSVSPSQLWPPNNKLVSVTASVAVSDAASGPNGFVLQSVTSSEGGPTSADVQGFVAGSPSTTGQLRAQRAGAGAGRVYTLTYRGFDRAGNAASCSATVTVPHDQRK